MLRLLKIFLKTIAVLLVSLICILTAFFLYGYVLYASADMQEPAIAVNPDDYRLSVKEDSLRVCGSNSLFLNEYGLWECVLEGSAVERGAAYGVMAEDLLYFQEDAFVGQIRRMIPSEGYLHFLRAFLEIFNRNMADHVPLENREEISALALSCSHDHDIFGTPYERQMHYHAAHDIGHMMQEYMLVGCSSFAVWGRHSADSSLIVGRNFDFWVGDDFARNRQVLFVNPDNGYNYVSVSWPGMTGVVSGMNEKGLTVTLNAAKGAVPVASAMPISILARRILQYAGTIDQACQIAQEAEIFVSESILVASAEDGCAAVIEKTPEVQAIYKGYDCQVLCTNHYQSDEFAEDPANSDNIATTDSPYRMARLKELIDSMPPLDPVMAVEVLRDRMGLSGINIGFTNEKSLNQDIAHHSVVFQPSQLKMWVSTEPWQSGAYLCYDLAEVFASDSRGCTLSDMSLMIEPDASFIEADYKRVLDYRHKSSEIRDAVKSHRHMPEWELLDFIDLNPFFYETYDIVGDYHLMRGDIGKAVSFWNKALQMEIPRVRQKEYIEDKIYRYDTE